MSATEASLSTPVLLCTLLPVTLLVVSSVLLDRALRHESVWNRSRAQIWIWLALAVLSTVPETTQQPPLAVVLAWGHLTLFLNLLAVLVHAPSRGRSSSRNLFRDVVPILPLSSGSSVLVATGLVCSISNSNSNSKDYQDPVWSIRTFFASVVGIWFLRWYLRRTRKAPLVLGLPVAHTVGSTTTATTATTSDHCGGIVARLCGMAPTASDSFNTNASSARTASESCWLDERCWYTWNRVQTMQWFAQQLSSSSSSSSTMSLSVRDRHSCRGSATNYANANANANANDNDNENDGKFHEPILERLAIHSITGDVLHNLSESSQWITLGVPFGPACRLADAIARLVERYPEPGVRARTAPRTIRNSERNDCLDLHDELYNNNPQRARRVRDVREFLAAEVTPQHQQHSVESSPPLHPRQQQQQQQPQHPQDPVIQGGMTEDQREKLNNVMKERFGLELPKLRAADFVEVQKGLLRQADNHNKSEAIHNPGTPQLHPLATNGTPPSSPPSTLPRQPYQEASLPPQNSTDHGTIPAPLFSPQGTGIPGSILDAMPPEIREIAKRRPDLMGTIWKTKQQQVLKQSSPQQQQHHQQHQHHQHHQQSFLRPEPSAEEPYTADIDDETEGSDDDEDETTSLIPREDDEFPLRYRSIGKSRIEGIV